MVHATGVGPQGGGTVAGAVKTRRNPLLLGTVVAVVALLASVGAAAAVSVLRDDGTEERDVEAELRFLPEDSENPLEAAPTTGTPVPTSTWEKLDGSGLGSFADYEGTPVVVNFWGSWCAPCREEMPAFQRVFESLRGEVAFLGLAVQETAKASRAFVEEVGTTYDVGRDPAGKLTSFFGAVRFPSTFFVDAAGNIVAARAGELDEDELRALIDEHLR